MWRASTNCLVKFAKCCTPVPGDPVVGFITRGFGVSVHRCATAPTADPARRKPEEAGRWVQVRWAEGELASYRTSLEMSAKDRDGLTLDVAMGPVGGQGQDHQPVRPVHGPTATPT